MPPNVMFGMIFSGFCFGSRCAIVMPVLLRSSGARSTGPYVSVFWLTANDASLNIVGVIVLVECSVARRPGCWKTIGVIGKFSDPSTQTPYSVFCTSELLLRLTYSCQLLRGE